MAASTLRMPAGCSRLGFNGLAFGVLGFRVWGFRVWGFRVKGLGLPLKLQLNRVAVKKNYAKLPEYEHIRNNRVS